MTQIAACSYIASFVHYIFRKLIELENKCVFLRFDNIICCSTFLIICIQFVMATFVLIGFIIRSRNLLLRIWDVMMVNGGALHSCNITNWPLIWSHIAMCTCLGFWFWMTLQVWLDSLYFPRPNWMTGDRCRGWQIYLPTFTLSAEKAKCRCKPIVDFVKSQLLLGGFTNCLKRRQSPVNRWTP